MFLETLIGGTCFDMFEELFGFFAFHVLAVVVVGAVLCM